MKYTQYYGYRQPERTIANDDAADVNDLADNWGEVDRDVKAVENMAVAAQQALDTHEANRVNPHGVTAAQVGAYTKAEVDERVDGYDSHLADESNPHNTTAAQVGAYSIEQSNVIKEGLEAATAAVQEGLENHCENTLNPHGVTAYQTGAYTAEETDTLLAVVHAALQLLADDKADAAKVEQKLAALQAGKADIEAVLAKDNTEEYVPSGDYNPATVKFVLDALEAGNMQSSVYDPQGLAQDIFAYINGKVPAALPTVSQEEGLNQRDLPTGFYASSRFYPGNPDTENTYGVINLYFEPKNRKMQIAIRQYQPLVILGRLKADDQETEWEQIYPSQAEVQYGEIKEALESKADKAHIHTKAEIGLGNADNTADMNKTVKQAAKADFSSVAAQLAGEGEPVYNQAFVRPQTADKAYNGSIFFQNTADCVTVGLNGLGGLGVNNSLKLGGQPPSYYATAAAVKSAQSKADAAMPQMGGTFAGQVKFRGKDDGMMYINVAEAGSFAHLLTNTKGFYCRTLDNSDAKPCYASNTSFPSSLRYKQVVGLTTAEKANKLLGLQVKDYKYKEGTPFATGKVLTGLIAEEVAEELPELVYYQEGRIEGINYTNIVPLLLKQLQVQEKRIAVLESWLGNNAKETNIANDFIVEQGDGV